MMGRFDGFLENLDVESHIVNCKNMEAERPLDGIEQPFLKNDRDILSVEFAADCSERPTDYLPKEPVLHNENSIENQNRKEHLDDRQKKDLKEYTGWSDEIVDNIGSTEEAKIYEKAELSSVKIDGKWCLIRKDINLEVGTDYIIGR
jgi:hypothetical protein